MKECVRCESSIDAGGGLLAKVGFGGTRGWECPNCGVMLCEDCVRERKINMILDYDQCPACEAMLEHR